VNNFNRYFIVKVAAIRASTDGASDPSFKSCVVVQSLTAFDKVSIHDVIVAIN
jgi:hypothetical protein